MIAVISKTLTKAFFWTRRGPLAGRKFYCACGALASALFAGHLNAHHPGGSQAGRVLGDVTPAPRSQLALELEYLKGERGNRDVWTATAAGELAFFEGRLGLGLQVPYRYYEQRDRADAARFARPRLGARAQPFPELQAGSVAFFFVADVDLGFASGADRKRFVDENFYDSAAGLTLGISTDDWLFTLRGGGVFPVTRLPRAEENQATRLPWEPGEETIARETHELKKVTEWSVRAGYRVTESLLPYVGFRYRTPYAGVVKERASGDSVPSVYREVEAGVVYNVTTSVALHCGYRYPLFRKRPNSALDEIFYILQGESPPDPAEFRLFDEAYTVSLSVLF